MVGNEDLGKHLRALREATGLSLRDVQEKTDDAVKNSYLSQIEGGRIGRPSPNVLWHLAQVYGTDYNDLLTRAGHRVALPPVPGTALATDRDVAFSLIEDLSEDEERTVREFIEFLKSQRNKGSTGGG
jgi:transcriptional regulator with XRE-family HTH domain